MVKGGKVDISSRVKDRTWRLIYMEDLKEYFEDLYNVDAEVQGFSQYVGF